MQTSKEVTKIFPALISAHEEMKDPEKNAINPHFKSEYVDLEEAVKVIRPVLAKHKLALVQSPSYKDGVVLLVSRIIHESGEWIEDEASAGPLEPGPQKAGSAITYLRRYALMAMCGIAPKDDDANLSELSHKKKKTATKVEPSGDEQRQRTVINGFNPTIKQLFKQAKIWTVSEMYKCYSDVHGDMDALTQLLAEKIKKIK